MRRIPPGMPPKAKASALSRPKRRMKSRPALPFSRFLLLLGNVWDSFPGFSSSAFGIQGCWPGTKAAPGPKHPPPPPPPHTPPPPPPLKNTTQTWLLGGPDRPTDTQSAARSAAQTPRTHVHAPQSSCLCRGRCCKRIPLAGALSGSINLRAFDRNYVHLFSHSLTQRLQLRLRLQASGLFWPTRDHEYAHVSRRIL